MNRPVQWNDSEGWVAIADVIDRAACDQIVDACGQLISDATNRHPRDKPASGTQHLEDLATRVQAVADLIERPRLGDLVDAMLETVRPGRPRQPDQVSYRCPQPGFGGQDLHRDTAESIQGPLPTVVTAIIALCDFTTVNGATRVVPGSHRTNESALSYRGRKSSPNELLLIGPAGTAFVFSGHLLHSGTQNGSSEPRPALQIVWR